MVYCVYFEDIVRSRKLWLGQVIFTVILMLIADAIPPLHIMTEMQCLQKTLQYKKKQTRERSVLVSKR